MSEENVEWAEGDWEDLLVAVEQGNVIPVIGEGAVTFGDANEPLYPTLARELARELGVNPSRLSPEPTLSEVSREHLMRRGERNKIYARLDRVLKTKNYAPGTTLAQLADIDGFQLYLSTTFDPLLSQAIEKSRGACGVADFCPNGLEKDLPQRVARLAAPTVYHLLGKSSVAPGTFVAWEEDLLDFLWALPRHLGSDTTRNLSQDLSSHFVLALGLHFSDWVLRLLLRSIRQDALSRVEPYTLLAEGGSGPAASTALFFDSVNPTIKVVQCPTAAAFVAELHKRWRARHPKTEAAVAPQQPGRGLVFVSYAREDEAAARNIERRLREAGCRVYFDRDRLGVGHNFHYQLQDQINEMCAIFVSVVSATTEGGQGDHYFHRERNWAAKRLEGYAQVDQAEFYLPVLVQNQVPDQLLREPRETLAFQRRHAPGGALSAADAASIRALQVKHGVGE